MLDARRWTPDAGLWTLDSGRWALDAELWTLDSGRWTLDPGRLDPGRRTLDAGPWMLGSGRWTLVAGSWTVDVKTLNFKILQSFGNNGFISITLFLNSTLIEIFGHFRYENLSTFYSFQATLLTT